MLKHILDQEIVDKTAIASKIDGFEKFLESLKDYDPENVATLMGIAPELIHQAAEIYAKAPSAMILISEGSNRAMSNAENGRAAAALAVISGHVGKESCGVMVFGEKSNSQGALDMGLTPKHLPGFGLLEDEEARKKFESLWKTKLPSSAGMNSREILEGAESGAIKGIYLVGENPVDTYPDRVLTEKALNAAEFVVVQDMFFNSTAKMADVVLPACSALEKEGSFTSSERRIQRVRPSTKEKLGRSDLEIFNDLSILMGNASFAYDSPADVMTEISKSVEFYAGVSYDRLGLQGLMWPVKDSSDDGSLFLYGNGYPHGRVKLGPAPELNLPKQESNQFLLVPGITKFHSGSMSTWGKSLLEVCPEPMAQMCSSDMSALGLEDGDTIKVTNDLGDSMKLKVKWSRRPLEKQIVVPYHFPGSKLNKFVKWNEPLAEVKVEKA